MLFRGLKKSRLRSRSLKAQVAGGASPFEGGGELGAGEIAAGKPHDIGQAWEPTFSEIRALFERPQRVKFHVGKRNWGLRGGEGRLRSAG